MKDSDKVEVFAGPTGFLSIPNDFSKVQPQNPGIKKPKPLVGSHTKSIIHKSFPIKLHQPPRHYNSVRGQLQTNQKR